MPFGFTDATAWSPTMRFRTASASSVTLSISRSSMQQQDGAASRHEKRAIEMRGRAGWRRADIWWAIPIVGLVLGMVRPSRAVPRAGVSVLNDRLKVAEALALISALILTVIGSSYIALDADELINGALFYTIGPYGCVTEDDWLGTAGGGVSKHIDLDGGLVGLGMTAIAFSFVAVFQSLLCILGASTATSNRSAMARKRWWNVTWPIYVLALLFLIGGLALTAWFYLRVYLLK